MRARATFLVLALGVLILPSFAHAERQYLTYDEALAAGVDVGPLPADEGMAACTDATVPDPGFATEQDAESEMALIDLMYGEDGPQPECMADPHLGVYVVDPTPPVPPGETRRWAGPETVGYFEGGRSTVEVGNPDVCHPCAPGVFKFFVARPLASTDAGNWMEAGWVEQSDHANDQYVYWARNISGKYTEHIFTDAYDLTVGRFYVFRVRQRGSAGSFNVISQLWYHGRWNLLQPTNGMRCQNPDSSGNCRIEFRSEAQATDQNYFDLNAPVGGEGVNHVNVRIRVNPNDWRLFDKDAGYNADVAADAPYKVCWIHQYYNFRTPKGGC